MKITGTASPPQERERLLIPFLALQVIDFLLSLLTMFSSYIQVPVIISVSSLGHTGHSRIPLLALQLLDFCLSILTLCSSYMEVPTYLSLKPGDSRGSVPVLESLPAEEYAKVMITFTIAFVAVLVLKVKGSEAPPGNPAGILSQLCSPGRGGSRDSRCLIQN
ncbi:lysosomal-associated transmembrane protein 5-like [Cyanistes caeruleus]|uniref:lysosomal-associated transmembrane protein 5-like n=1 Tax=Cyanistes caeruleus TaxID=156563 RepID=UPI000CDB34DF|nr:lysosomal-associated transmembrane protein 5-like [Cyanistes caeruleus]